MSEHSLAMRMKNIPRQLLAAISQTRFTLEKLLTREMATIWPPRVKMGVRWLLMETYTCAGSIQHIWSNTTALKSWSRALREGSFTGDPGLWNEGSGDRHLSSWGLSWATRSGFVYRGLWEMAEGALEVGHLSLWELCEVNLEGGLPCWVPWR